jgi:hypothetical protein
MTRGDLKTSRTGNRTPFQILADYFQTGDTRDRDLWRDYTRVTRCLAAGAILQNLQCVGRRCQNNSNTFRRRQSWRGQGPESWRADWARASDALSPRRSGRSRDFDAAPLSQACAPRP